MAVSLREQAKAIEDGKEAPSQPAMAPAGQAAAKARQLPRKAGRAKRTPLLPAGGRPKTPVPRPASSAQRKAASKRAV